MGGVYMERGIYGEGYIWGGVYMETVYMGIYMEIIYGEGYIWGYIGGVYIW